MPHRFHLTRSGLSEVLSWAPVVVLLAVLIALLSGLVTG